MVWGGLAEAGPPHIQEETVGLRADLIRFGQILEIWKAGLTPCSATSSDDW